MICSRCECEFEDGKTQCPSCRQWCHVVTTGESDTIMAEEVKVEPHNRVLSGVWDPILSEPPGTVVTGAYLMGGSPGAGKSTLSLQYASALCEVRDGECLYIATEEALSEITLRMHRLGIAPNKRFRFMRQSTYDPGRWESIFSAHPPKLFLLDSISGLTEDVHAQVRICSFLKKMSIKHQAPSLIIAHITKQDDFAGLLKLQHTVDALLGLQLVGAEGEVRSLKAYKNRFGPTSRDVKLLMGQDGLKEYVPPVKKKRKKAVEE
jgi:DNA repair protein RadA/Sms